jgi:hypothetical protein
MPVHIQNKDIQGKTAVLVSPDHLCCRFCTIVIPPTEPVAERIAWQEGDISSNMAIVSERCHIVVAMSKDVNIQDILVGPVPPVTVIGESIV